MSGPAAQGRILCFGPFELDGRAGELRKHGIRIKLRAQPVQILLMLLEHPGEVVLRDEIRQRLWPNNTIVEFDHGINAAVQKLRDALGESAEKPRYVETVARRGYRFLGNVEKPSEEAPPAPDPKTRIEPARSPLDPSTLTGLTLGHYRILKRLGAGGMGVVYEAEDLSLGRKVALKFLPSPVGELPETVIRRFEREARAASALSHPNICTVYGFENLGGQPAIAMELVDGESLEQRLQRGPLGPEALRLAIQVADGLAEAHRKGVVHRDLKPGNIMLTKAGVKILDFGLAKLEGPAVAVDGTRTLDGVVQGTLQYMSPEQTRGEEVDWRSDVFSFGAVLHEMLTGACPFKADGNAGAIAVTPGNDPPALQRVSLDRVVRRCLAKEREERWQSVLDLKAELQWIAEGAPAEDAAPARGNRRWGAMRSPWTAVVGLAMLVLALAAVILRERPSGPVVRFQITPPEGAAFGGQPAPVVSPDGKRIIFYTYWKQKYQIWLRSLDSTAVAPLLGPDGGMLDGCAGFWSPDSKSFAYFAENKLKRIDVDRPGGPSEPAILCDATKAAGGTWNRDGVLLFSTFAALNRVADTGGVVSEVLKTDPGRAEGAVLNPWFLPDGRHFLYESAAEPFPLAPKTMMVASLDAPQGKILFDTDSQPVFANGRILYVKDEMLLARRFDARAVTTTGEPIRVVDRIAVSSGLSPFSVSDSGPLVYIAGADTPPNEVVWLDRKGNRIESVTEVRLSTLQFSSPQLSPDRKMLAIENRDQGRTGIWLYDMDRKRRAPFTLDALGPVAPVWSPDGRSIAFASNRKGHFDIYRRAADGSGEEQLLYADGDEKYPASWSPDGRLLLFERHAPKTGRITVWILPLTGGSGQPFALEQSVNNETQPEFSPDGKWITFTAGETGRPQVYVVPSHDGGIGTGGKRQISTIAGSRARWRKDGKELYYQNGRSLLAVSVEHNGKMLQFGEPQELFSGVSVLGYDVSDDGQRFLVALRNRQSGTLPLMVVLNWTATMKK